MGKYTDVAGHDLPGPARSDRFFRVPDAKDSHCITETQGGGCGKARKREGVGCVGNLRRALASPSKANQQRAEAMLRGLQTHGTPFACFNSLQSQSLFARRAHRSAISHGLPSSLAEGPDFLRCPLARKIEWGASLVSWPGDQNQKFGSGPVSWHVVTQYLSNLPGMATLFSHACPSAKNFRGA